MPVKPEQLLYILGSPTRREILQMLAERASYVSEIAEELDVGQKAILEHLELMEEAGILEPKFKKIEKGRPRKYFAISRNFMLEINLLSNHLDIRVQTAEIYGRGAEEDAIDRELLEEFPRVKKLISRLERIEGSREDEGEIEEIKNELLEEREKLASAKRAIDYLLSVLGEAGLE